MGKSVANWDAGTTRLLCVLLIIVLLSPACLQDAVEMTDYCQWETFTAECPQDSVIVMEKALYGRMNYGRCVKRDYGYVGCFQDVLHLADARCSGTHSCQIPIPDKVFDKAIATTCPEDLRRYLQASYTCRRVISPSKQSCQGSDFARPRQSKGVLASIVTEETGCGTAETPWLLEVLPGQRISLTLHDFGIGNRVNNGSDLKDGPGQSRHCHVYAIIKEQHPAKSETICGSGDRVKHIYESASNSVEVRILGATANRNARNFLLDYTAEGCPDITTPRGGWVQRQDDSVIVGCSDPAKTWRLTCNGTQWMGQLGNCSSDDTSALLLGNLPHASSVFIVVVVATIVGLVVLIIGLMCLKRAHRRRQPRRMAGNIDSKRASNPDHLKEERFAGPGSYTQAKQQPLLSYNDNIKIEENEYAYVEDVLPFDTLKSTCDNTMNRLKQEKFEYNLARDTGHYTSKPTAMAGEHQGFPTMTSRRKDTPEIAPQYFVLDCEKGNNEHTCIVKDPVPFDVHNFHHPHRQVTVPKDDPRFIPFKR